MASILKTGWNCWRMEQVDRLRFLIDGADYFATLRAAMKKAQHTIYILSWDINSQLELVRDAGDDGYPEKLGEFLNALTDKNQNLNIYILNWDFAMIYSVGREWFPIYQLEWKTNSRVHFCLDDYQPAGASQHQKAVIIDDTLAFIGGLDLTLGRWDTPDHDPDNPKRDGADKTVFRPFHDVQLMLEGDAAAALAELFRERWKWVVHEDLPSVDNSGTDNGKPAGIWPENTPVDITNVTAGLARTSCAFRQQGEVREILNCYLDAIDSARRYIYIENQYFTVPSIAEAMQRSLEKAQGPEIVIVQPRETDGWLARMTMDVLRIRLIEQLQAHDKHDRLRVYYPDGPGLAEFPINVHAKILVVDDRLVAVGSANLNNRSMSLDNECMIIIDAESDDTLRQSVSAFRNRLLAEHLSCSPDQMQDTLNQTDSLIAAIEKLTDNRDRHLEKLPMDLAKDVDQVVPDTEIADPEEPLEPELFVNRILPEAPEKSIKSRIANWLWMVGTLTLLSALWHWTPLSSWIDLQPVSDAMTAIRRVPALPVWIVAGFVLIGCTRLPVSLFVVMAVTITGLMQGLVCSLVGGLLSALLVYHAGSRMSKGTVRKLAGSKLNSISNKLAQHGVISIVAVRIIPAAPFSLTNLVAGASHFNLRDFLAGTAVGMIPGLFIVSLITERALASIAQPSPENLAGLTLTVAIAFTAAYFLMSWIRRKTCAPEKHRNHQ
ncbi:Phosphatidylserine/phosphatidylglycerophosphate/cardiolipin synthase [Nitrosomonas marina]|uniref:Phosphatidylserine/phosphatidylglycerophosphate/cardiolipin synthase n=1 Tax=Nitrosomonas marina TaxID=917 RepID=A0A1I0C6N1_9PROT|nr:VTT domain-containing protein [Nitrosomonas marina]SET15030.1 Phosphatidylserine/phosphatidylglycerophosphate/cardiolipin synthase [Nitrosomonas marina]